MSVRRLKLFLSIYFLFVGPQVLIHLFLGSSLGCVTIWALCIAIGFAIVYHGGLHNTMVWISLMFIARYVGVASLLKIGLGQSLDSYLYTPVETYLMTLCTVIELYLAYRLAARFSLRIVVFKDINDLTLLYVFSYIAVIIGAITFFLTNLRSKYDFELGGFKLFMECIYVMGIIARTAYVLRSSQGRSFMDPFLGLVLSLGIISSVVSNTKSTAISCMLAYMLTVIGTRRAVPWKLVVVGAGCIWLLIGVITPVIHHLRTQDANNKTMSERLEDIVDFLGRGSLADARDEVGIYGERTQEITAYFGPLGVFHITAQRLAVVQNADPIKRGIDANGYLGPSFLLGGFAGLIPRILNPDKDMEAPADRICWHAGVQDSRVVNLQPIGIVAGSYAIAGWIGVAMIPLVVYTIYFFLQRLWSSTSSSSIFAVYFVTDNYNKFIEFDPVLLISVLFKEIFLEMVFFLILILASKLVVGILLTRRSPAPRTLTARPTLRAPGRGLGA
jgi:hypothetical protein